MKVKSTPATQSLQSLQSLQGHASGFQIFIAFLNLKGFQVT